MKKVLITGAAGFIGANLTSKLISKEFEVCGVDSFTNYYSAAYKKSRVTHFGIESVIRDIDISNKDELAELFQEFQPEAVVNLAAQGGVRASKVDPYPYIVTNQLGFLNVMELCEGFQVEKFIYASSSSVYGDGLELPFAEEAALPEPKSLYAASKISNELMARYYPTSGVQRIGLRFFTVYGPFGRPDMAVFRLLASSLLGRPFILTADLSVSRDFTFVDDVSTVVDQLLTRDTSGVPGILNVAGSRPYSLSDLLRILQEEGISIEISQSEPDSLDSKITHGATRNLESLALQVPSTSLKEGLLRTWAWMKSCDIRDIERWYEYSS